MNPDLKHWLHRATKGVPAEIREMIQEEMHFHYEDALEAHLDAGSNWQMAHNAALADLGDPHTTARALRQIHAPSGYYLRAALISLAPSLLVVLLLMVNIPALLGYEVVQGTSVNQFAGSVFMLLTGFISVAAMVYILRGLRNLIGLESVRLLLPSRFICGGMAVLLIPAALTILLPPTPDHLRILIINDPIAYYTPQPVAPFQWLLAIPTVAGLAAVGLGWMLLAIRLDRHRAQLYGLSLVLCATFVIGGAAQLMLAVETMRQTNLSESFWVTLAVITGVFKAAVFTLLFFRAAYDDNASTLAA